MRLFLRPKPAALLSALLLAALAALLAYPGFRAGPPAPGERELEELLSLQPLAMDDLPSAMERILAAELRANMRDWWGFQYPPAGDVYIQQAALQQEESAYNQGVERYRSNLNEAIALWSRFYTHYPAMVTGRQATAPRIDPVEEHAMVLLALTRYNRGTAMMEMAAGYRAGDPKIPDLLKQAIYDLRRAVGTFERLGRDGSGRQGYWQGRSAWQGTALRGEHAGFPIHHAYANLSIAYLRLYDKEPRYPESNPDYLRGQARKYADDQNRLSPIVSIVTQDALANWDNLKREQYRLILALQNLEASSRGMRDEAEARFNYTIGLLLSHVNRRDAKHVNTGDAADYLEQAIRAGDDEAAVAAARKELALLYLETGNQERLLGHLLALDAILLEDSLTGPRKSFGLLFTDLARAGDLARGDLKRVFNHLALRREAFRQNRLDPASQEPHEAIDQALADAFFIALRQRLTEVNVDRAGAIVHWLNGLADLDQFPRWRQAFEQHLMEPERTRYAVNLALRSGPVGFAAVFWAKIAVAVVLLAFWATFYWAHRRMALRLLRSQYQNEALSG